MTSSLMGSSLVRNSIQGAADTARDLEAWALFPAVVPANCVQTALELLPAKCSERDGSWGRAKSSK